MINRKVFYRVVTPPGFSNLDYSTLEEAKGALMEFGDVPQTSSYYEYWQQQKAACRLVKVTEITEPITEKVSTPAKSCEHRFDVTDDVFDYCVVCGEKRPALKFWEDETG